jgi:ferredoxin
VALKIEINREACMGSGNCSFWAPGVFDLDDEGVAIVIDPEAAPEEKVILAGQGCPTQAIAITKNGEKIV